jgi:hypothetical protein
MARLAEKSSPGGLYALALARPIRISWRRFPFTLPLSMAPWLFAPSLLAVSGRAILLARLPTPPTSSLLLTCFTAKMGSPMPRPEQPSTSFEQTEPGPMMTPLWTFADVP